MNRHGVGPAGGRFISGQAGLTCYLEQPIVWWAWGRTKDTRSSRHVLGVTPYSNPYACEYLMLVAGMCKSHGSAALMLARLELHLTGWWLWLGKLHRRLQFRQYVLRMALHDDEKRAKDDANQLLAKRVPAPVFCIRSCQLHPHRHPHCMPQDTRSWDTTLEGGKCASHCPAASRRLLHE